MTTSSVYSIGYDPEKEETILTFSDGTNNLIVRLPETEVNRLIRMLEAAIDKQNLIS